MNILLIGPRGSGKSTIGRALAARLKRPFIDLDAQALATFALPGVADVWKTHGESAWRDAEVRCLRRALNSDIQVIAPGGGAVMIPAARDVIERAQRAEQARVVYLKCSVSTLLERLRREPGDRPPLSNQALEVEVARILEQREPTYTALADVVIDGNARATDVTEALARELRL
jgi:shikimate kinase